MKTRCPARPLMAAAALLLVAAPPLHAQQPPPWVRGGMGFFQAGYLGLDLADLNRSLEGAGYPALKEDVATMGGAGYGVRDRFLFGVEGHGVLGRDETTTDGVTRVEARGGYALFRVGYRAYRGARVDVFPLVGIGGGSMEVRFTERSAPTFDDILIDPRTSTKLSTEMFLLDASAGLTYRINLRGSEEDDDRRGPRNRSRRDDDEDDDDDGPGGLLLGVQVGYVFAPGESSWHLDDINTVAGGPNLQIEGLHVRISIGGWGSDR